MWSLEDEGEKMKKILAIFVLVALVIPSVMAMTANDGKNVGSIMLNNPPAKPTISGPASGETGKSYTYTAVTTDPDGDKVFYCFDWGDGDEICTDLYNSGQEVTVSHTWNSDGDYTITVKATDENGAESEPATLKVTMPLSYDKNPTNDISVRIVKPRNGIYFHGIKILPILGQIVIGDITVEVRTSGDVQRVEFLLQMACGCGREIIHVDTSAPFTWDWNQDYDNNELIDEGRGVPLMVRAYDSEWNGASDDIRMIKL